MIGFLLNNPVTRAIGAALAALAAIVSFGAWKKREGRQEGREAAEKADRDLAQRIRETADEIPDTDGDALERLRRRGRVRDD